MASFKFNGFISYSHAADQRLAPAVQKGLHTLARPWYRMRALRIFRDQVALAAAPNLWKAIELALSQSEWFLLLASPKAAQSYYVQQEIIWWLANRPLSRLLILLTDGELSWDHAKSDFDWTQTTALPPLMAGRFSGEPLYVDLRLFRDVDSLTLRHVKFRSAILDIAAPLHGIDKDQLVGEDVRRQKGLVRIGWTITATITGLGFAVYGQRNAAIQSRIEAELESSGNALFADKSLEASMTALAAGHRSDSMRRGINGLYWKLLHRDGLENSVWRARSRLHQILSSVHERNRWLGHSDRVETLAASSRCPDGGFFVISGGRDGTALVWEPDGSKRFDFDFGSPVQSVAISPNCAVFAAASEKIIRLWDHSGKPLAAIDAGFRFSRIAFAPEGESLWSGDAEGWIRNWSLNGRMNRRFRAHPARITALTSAICPDLGALLASGSAAEHDSIKLWNGQGELVQTFKNGQSPGAPAGRLNSLAIRPGCSEVASAHQDHLVRIWNRAGKPAGTSLTHSGPVNGVSYSPDGHYLAAVTEADLRTPDGPPGAITVWRDGQPIGVFRGHVGPITAIAFGPDGTGFFSGGADNTVRHWSIEPPLKVQTFEGEDAIREGGFSTDGKMLYRVLRDGRIQWINLADGKMREIEVSGNSFQQIALTDDGDLYGLSADQRHLIALSRRESITISSDRGPVKTFVFGAGGIFATATEDGWVEVHSPDGKRLAETKGYSVSSRTLAIHPDGELLAFPAGETEPQRARLWNWRRNSVIDLPNHGAAINAIRFSLDGQLIASAGADHLVRLVNMDGSTHSILSGHGSEVVDVAFHRSGRALATAGFDDQVKLWTPDGTPLLTLQPGLTNIIALGWSGDALTSLWLSGTAVQWNLNLKQQLHIGCRWLSNALTARTDDPAIGRHLCKEVIPAGAD